MAEKRMLSKVISVSEKVNMLPDIFSMLLFTWMIPHADDYGRLPGSPAKVKALVVPMLDKSLRDVEQAIRQLEEQGVIVWYETDGDKVIEIVNFAQHQEGLKSKKKSKFNSPERQITLNNSYLSASESDIEDLLVDLIQNDGFIDDEEITSVEQQLRIDNSYLDIVATGTYRRYLFEVKRQRLSNTAIEQIVKYRTMLKDSKVVCTLIGNGLASNFDLQRCRDEQINVVMYDDLLNLEYPLLFNVKYRHLRLLANRTELNRTEQNLTEEKRKEQEQKNTRGDGRAYRIFEQEGFGTISSIISDQIHDLVNDYGIRWYEEAMKVAVLSGKRTLSYVKGILKHWKATGIDDPWKEENYNGRRDAGNRRGAQGMERANRESAYSFLDENNGKWSMPEHDPDII
ncbi:DnaD domain-containing protein [Paenibacillus shenyangensis]|uniref:DnaD domain-containing protein n=1 Tax=Paenibacillus sp. A9 TaxID=1284352 RepID=UPI000687B9B1|nr:DnaD domain protein [Paenibacillus sp. A9]